jgi:hypothetical protein
MLHAMHDILVGEVMRRHGIALATIAILSTFCCRTSFAGSFDGVYKGTMDLNTAVANDPRCSKSWLSVLEVKDNHMLLTTDTKSVNIYSINVGSDGAFKGRASVAGDSDWRTFTGAIAGPNVTGQFYNQSCHYLINFRREQ